MLFWHDLQALYAAGEATEEAEAEGQSVHG